MENIGRGMKKKPGKMKKPERGEKWPKYEKNKGMKKTFPKKSERMKWRI